VPERRRGLRENASAPGGYRVRAVSLSQLGRIDEGARSNSRVDKGAGPLENAQSEFDRYVKALKRADWHDSLSLIELGLCGDQSSTV
jgi:hypothetical protein